MKYSHVLFDADETLFSFNAFEGLKVMFANYGVEFTESDYHHYQATNKPLWVAYQKHEITASELQHPLYRVG